MGVYLYHQCPSGIHACQGLPVACLADAVAPTVPTVLDNCNLPLTVGTPVISADPVCARNKDYTYTFTDCADQTYQWIYTYTISTSSSDHACRWFFNGSLSC